MKLNNKTKTIIAMSIVLIAFTIITAISAMNKYKPTIEVITPTSTPELTPSATVPDTSPTVPISTPDATLTPAPTESPTPTVFEPSVGNSEAIGEITIRTDRKTRTYDLMGDVDEDTLKRNIGHLPGSSLPGQDGACVLMGHRDTDFSILRYSKVGDMILVKYNDVVHSYTVKYIEIVDGDDQFRFDAMEGESLVLVTCYPFRYSGAAPQKCLVICTG